MGSSNERVHFDFSDLPPIIIYTHGEADGTFFLFRGPAHCDNLSSFRYDT